MCKPSAALLAGVLGLSVTLAHALDLSGVPLFLTTGADPNVMFTLDDSGSMQFEMMPESLTFGQFSYLFPRSKSSYSAGGRFYVGDTHASYCHGEGDNRATSGYPCVFGYEDNNIYNYLSRSPDVNKLYYNPDIDYAPWAKSDGTLYADANPDCAPHNPINPATECRNLKVVNDGGAETTTNSYAKWLRLTPSGYQWYTGNYVNGVTASSGFWPATFYRFVPSNSGCDTSITTAACYTKVEIHPDTVSYTNPGGKVRTYTEEIQNFANWYTYYRSRILAARAGVGRAFAKQGSRLRVGFAAINEGSASIDGVSTATLIRGVRPFTGTDRTNFFDQLYNHPIPAEGTPLRKALQDVGNYFERSDDKGPWGKTPGTADTTAHLACRRSYNILTTDGYWNDADTIVSSLANTDNEAGASITPYDTSKAAYQYQPVAPYADNHSKTLADVAMQYWKRDLRTNLDNRVPTSPDDPAFWQHLVNLTVGYGVSGSLPYQNVAGVLNAANAGTAINWPDPTSDAAKIDDLLHAAVNSRGEFFSADDPDSFAQALSDALSSIEAKEGSSSSIAANSTRLDTNTVVYQARFNSNDWSGQVLAFPLDEQGGLGEELWDAGTLIPAAASRSIFTYNASATPKGVAFTWENLNATQQTALNTNTGGANDSLGSDRLSWLRGDQSKEVDKPNGVFRVRTRLLGDIVNSDPFFVGKSDYGYAALADPEGSAYTTFREGSAYLSRSAMLYVGGNDGMLHALDATTGVERFAYVPNAAFATLSRLTAPSYAHQYFVDGSPVVADVYFGSAWHSVLVGSMGAGGRGVFALDVTDPANFAAGNVLWEYSHAELGVGVTQPSVVRLQSGDWVAIFGNGYNSSSQKAMLFVVRLSDGVLLKLIDTEVGSTSTPNGLATPLAVDENGDRIADTAYAGDLLGNLWKFDLSGNASNWKIAYKSGNNPIPLFVAKNAANVLQPITAPPEVGKHPSGGMMVYFGTGKYFLNGDNLDVTGVQTFYGVRDNGAAVTRADLQAQTILSENSVGGIGARAVSSNAVNYTTKQGWYLDLVPPSSTGKGERVVTRPILRSKRVLFTTLIPIPDPCEYGGESWFMELDALNGARLTYSVFDYNNDGGFTNADNVSVTEGGQTKSVAVSGRRLTVGIGERANIISAGEKEYILESGSKDNVGGEHSIETIVGRGNLNKGRQSWRQRY